MGVRRLKIMTISPGVASLKDDRLYGLETGSDKMDEMHIFFSRPISSLEFAGITAAIEKAIR